MHLLPHHLSTLSWATTCLAFPHLAPPAAVHPSNQQSRLQLQLHSGSFKCPQPWGYFPDPSACPSTTFYECLAGVPFTSTCSQSQNSKRDLYYQGVDKNGNPVCKSDEEIKCPCPSDTGLYASMLKLVHMEGRNKGKDGKDGGDGDFKCPRLNGIFADPEDCPSHTFNRCRDGRARMEKCPFKLYFVEDANGTPFCADEGLVGCPYPKSSDVEVQATEIFSGMKQAPDDQSSAHRFECPKPYGLFPNTTTCPN